MSRETWQLLWPGLPVPPWLIACDPQTMAMIRRALEHGGYEFLSERRQLRRGSTFLAGVGMWGGAASTLDFVGRDMQQRNPEGHTASPSDAFATGVLG